MRKTDARIHINPKFGGFILMFSFFIIGLIVFTFQINKDMINIKDEIFLNNEIVSKEILMEVNLMDEFLENKSFGLQMLLSSSTDIDFDNQLNINVIVDRWRNPFLNNTDNKYYIFNTDAQDSVEIKELIDINAFNTFINRLNDNEELLNKVGFIYSSVNSNIQIVYPALQINDESLRMEQSKKILDGFKQIDLSQPGKYRIVDNSLYLWNDFSVKECKYYTGLVLSDLRSLISYLDLSRLEAIDLYVNNNKIELMENMWATNIPEESYNTSDFKLHEVVKDNQLYFYRRLNKEVLYISRISLMRIYGYAAMDNIAFGIIIVLAMIMILIIYIFFLKYRRFLELEMESSEQEFKKSIYKSRLGHIMNTISEAFVRADSTYTILEVNQAAADMLGYRISEMLGQIITDFMVKPLDVKVRKDEGLYNCYEVSLHKKNGDILYGLVNKSTVIKDNPIVKEHYIMISDITPLIEAQQKAEDANRSKSRFIANLSHEIRTPMNATIGYIYLLEQTTLTKEQKNYLAKMDYASNSLLEIIDEILDFSKIEADSIVVENISFNLKNVLQNAVSMFENTAFRKEINLILNIDTFVPDYVIGDPYRYRQILINLLSNAFKFTSIGHIKIQVSLIDLEESHLEETGVEQTIVKMTIEDTGIGIPPERMDILFDPFVQADESTTRLYGGTGLGLAICKRLIQLLNGAIYAESIEGKGSLFTIEVPFVETNEVEIQESTSMNKSKRKTTANKKILIVEDNPLNQELLVELLRQYGNSVVVANNGKIAEEILTKEHTTKFDLVLMDIQMPIQDGYTTTKHIRYTTTYSKVPIIAVTANADKETQIRIAETGMNDYLLKPINAEDLYRKIGMW